MEAMMSNPKLQEQAKLVAEPMMAMMGNEDLNANHMSRAQRSGDVLVDNLVNKLFDRAVDALPEDDLATMTVGKVESLTASRVSSRLSAPFVPSQRLPLGLAPSLARHVPTMQSSVFVRA